MLSIKTCAVCYIFLNVGVEIHTLVPFSTIEDNNLVTAEEAIRNTVNNLFEAFKVHGVKNRPKLKQLCTIHNFFISITLTDCDNLAEIVRLSRVNDVDNSTQNFIDQINKVLNADDKSKDENDNNVAMHIQQFIQKLKHLKESLSSKNTVVNAKILDYMDFDKRTVVNNREDNINSSKSNQELEEEKIFDEGDIWQTSGRRIYQGIRASIKKFPFMASVHFFEKFACAGSIIKNDLVITSASCLQIAWNNRFFRENPEFLSVRVGCEYYDFCGESISVLEIYFHPQYDPKALKHNIAIMRLKIKINFRRTHGRVKKIEVDRNPWSLPNTCTITVVGWGAKENSNIVYDVFRNKLSFAKLDMYLLKDCQEHYSKEFVSEKNFCAGFYSKGGGACNRDAGGPGIFEDTLMGVISFGSPLCGYAGAPTVFTKLGFYWDWIETIMEQEVATNAALTTTRYPSTILSFAVKSTTEEMKMYPLEETTPSFVSDETDALRMTQERAFEDFLSTIFESEEINTINDITDIKSKVNIERLDNTDNEQKKVLDFTDGDEETAEIAIESQKGVTVLDNASNDDRMNDDKSSNVRFDGNKGNDETEQVNSPKILDKDVMALIDDLDIDELLRSIIPLDDTLKSSELKENKETSLIRNIIMSVSNNLKNKLNISPNQKSPDELPIDKNGDGEEDGLSIEAEPFLASPIREIRKHTEIHKSSTQSSVTLAIQEKKINKRKRYLL